MLIALRRDSRVLFIDKDKPLAGPNIWRQAEFMGYYYDKDPRHPGGVATYIGKAYLDDDDFERYEITWLEAMIMTGISKVRVEEMLQHANSIQAKQI